jgi:hypothetical protein
MLLFCKRYFAEVTRRPVLESRITFCFFVRTFLHAENDTYLLGLSSDLLPCGSIQDISTAVPQ